jgi:hypothetical protein
MVASDSAMAADIWVGERWDVDGPTGPTVHLDDNGYYWFLNRYFEAANIEQSTPLIELYGDAEIHGYQLARLKDELKLARDDAKRRRDSFKVLVGWKGDVKSRETEVRMTVEREKLLVLIKQLLDLVADARERKYRLLVVGD